MPYPLNNVETSDEYDDFLKTLIPPRPVQKANITIANAAAFVQMERCDSMRVGAGVMLPEELWLPGVYSITREFYFGRIRFKSGATGIPAQIIASVAGS